MEHLRTAALQFLIWLTASGLAVAFLVRSEHYGEQFQTTVIGRAALDHPDRVWFDQTGALFASDRTPDGLVVRYVKSATGLDAAPLKTGRAILCNRSTAAYTVSPDGDVIASAKGSVVTLTSLGQQPSARKETKRRTEITHLAWMEGNIIVALHVDGALEVLDATELTPRTTLDSGVAQAASLVTNGTFFAVGSRARTLVKVFDLRMLPQISLVETLELRHPYGCLALSRGGRIAMCTGQGPVLGQTLLPGMVDPRALEFYDDYRMLAAGPSGLALVGGQDGPLTVPNVPAGVRSMVVNEGQLAAVVGSEVLLLTHRITPPISEAGWAIISRWLAATGVVALLLITRMMFRRADEVRERTRVEKLARIAD